MDDLTPADVPLLELIEELVAAKSWPQLRQIVQQNPILLSDRALRLLELVFGQARSEDEAQDDFRNLRRFMVRSKAVGVQEAYEELIEQPLPLWLVPIAETIQDTDDDLVEVVEYEGILEDPRFPELHPLLQGQILGRAASALLRRRDTFPEFDGLDRALRLVNESAALVPDDSVYGDEILAFLQYAFTARYESTDASSDLDAVLDVMRRQDIQRGEAPADRAGYLADFGEAMLNRYERHGRSATLERAAEVLRESVRTTSLDELERARRLDYLSMTSLRQYEVDGSIDHLEASIASSREALDLTPESAVESRRRLSNLGNALLARFECNGDALDLDAAISAFARSTASIQEDDDYQDPAILSNFGNGLWRRYEISGDMTDLDNSIGLLQRAVAATGRGSSPRAPVLVPLGVALRRRYEARGRLDDLNSAIIYLREAVDLLDPRVPNGALAVGNLGVAVLRRFEVTQGSDDLDEAIDLYRRAVALLPSASPELPTFLANLGSALVLGQEVGARADELDEAVASLERAVKLTSANSPELPRRVVGLSSGLLLRHTRDGDFSDVNMAARLLQQAVDLTGADSPDLPIRLTSLARCLAIQWDHAFRASGPVHSGGHRRAGNAATVDGLAERERIAELFRRACEQGLDSSILSTTGASAEWGEWAVRRRSWSEAAEAYAFGLIAVRRLAMLQVLRSQKELELKWSSFFANHSAFAFALAGDATNSTLSLEQGRAVLLDEALELLRTDLGQLRDAGWLLLAERYENAAAKLREQQGLVRSWPIDARE